VQFESWPLWLSDAVRRVLVDMQQPTPVPLTMGWSLRAGTQWWVWAGEGPQVTVGRWLIPGPSDIPGLTVLFALWLQEEVLRETDAAWGEARPACPGHLHPAQPYVLDEQAWWICPESRTRLARIGELANNPRPANDDSSSGPAALDL
jgi:hypothetical protein